MLMSGHVIIYAGDLNRYHNVICFFCRSAQFYLKQEACRPIKLALVLAVL